MAPNGEVFDDRSHAGVLLAGHLKAYHRAPGAIVLGLPRGGVVPAARIAETLELPLDVLISRKLRAPHHPELAIGAIAEGGKPFLYQESLDATGASQEYIAGEIALQQREIAHRQRLFRRGKALRLPPNATVILVDDGIATGSTVIAAIHALHAQRVEKIVLAAPVAAADTARRLRKMVDSLVLIQAPEWFGAVSQFYEQFEQVTDEEVQELLAHAQRHESGKVAVPGDTAPHGKSG